MGMKRLSIAKRAKVVKLMHIWQNTGRQKGLFAESVESTPTEIANAIVVNGMQMLRKLDALSSMHKKTMICRNETRPFEN